MTVANVSGWELSLPEKVSVSWDGGNNNVKVSPSNSHWASGGIIGMVSFNTGWRFRTEPGYSIWVGGSPNMVVPGAHPLSGIIPSSWWPDEFQMNWFISDPGRTIEFPEGFPFMFFTVINDSLLTETQILLDSQPESKDSIESRMRYGQAKMTRNVEQPWTWTKGIKTGLDADGNVIGPPFGGLPKLSEPNQN